MDEIGVKGRDGGKLGKGKSGKVKPGRGNAENRKKGKGMCPKLLGFSALLVMLPVYKISNGLYQLAVCRDNSHSFFRKEGVRKLAEDIQGVIAARKKKGFHFSDFTEELEEGRDWFQRQEKERITMASYDGLRLVAYYLPAEAESDKVMILMHGYRNQGIVWDFAGLVRFYHEQGYHLLVPHQRAHGESEGEHICFGVKERYDLVKWTEYIAGRFDGKCSIFLAGISMGAATVLMAAGLKLPVQVKGLIADCGYTSPWDIFAHVLMRNYHLPKFPLLHAADYICRMKAGFHFQECSTVESMKSNRIPVLFIHGGKDDFVPTDMGRVNYEACGAEKELLIVEQAAHGTSYLVEPEKYRKKVITFMEKWSDGE